MANKIEVRGVIVPSEYDVDFMFGYIQRGMITPESYIRKQIAQADPKKDIDLYINSPGGSVFAGNEMINALQDWAVENKKGFNITIGAMAASMGSAILVNLDSFAKKVKAHSNSKIMFHGAWSQAVGGADSMRDSAELLDKINNDIKVKLISKYDLSVEEVDEWFAEGREGWLSADEALEIGMVDEIIGQEDELPESADIDFKEQGMKIAALTLDNIITEEAITMDLVEIIKGIFNIKEDATDEEVMELAKEAIQLQNEENEDVCNESTDEQETEAVSDAESADEENGEEEEVSEESTGDDSADGDAEEDADIDVEEEEVTDLNEVCIEMNEKIDSLNQALNKKQSENDKLKADISELSARLEKLVGNGIAFEAEKPAPTDWNSCVEQCDGDYVRARKEFPQVFNKLMGKK